MVSGVPLLLSLFMASRQQTELVSAIARGDHNELRLLLDPVEGPGLIEVVNNGNANTAGSGHGERRGEWPAVSPLMVAAGLGDAVACALLCERLAAASSPKVAINRRSWVPNSTPFSVAP